MTSTTGAARPPRADARRNRDRILQVAEQHFSEHGVTGSLDQIAKSAGIGPGTLYRHFPNRAALLAALLAEREDHLTRELDDIAASSSDAATSLQRWLTALVEWASAFDGLPGPLRDAVSEEASPLALTCQGYITTTDTFLAAAQREGSARSDVRARDLFLATLAIAWVGAAAMADESSRPGINALIHTGWATR
ncbi:TetR/AcrR family transcriptional regulator [Cellulomonas cellasea]|nr:TetR/AcrR family transcriptional regulator [Cellulomonas cellasea]GEA87323.1 TetR family transcriptional regulator [Cellulomonas cellasea]